MTPILSSTLLRTQSDARLVALASRGGERAFEAIVERYRRPLLRWTRQVLPEARAEDAVQTTFLKAWTAIQSGAQIDDLKPWLYRVARNAALDNARKSGYDYDELTDALHATPGPQDEVERRQVMRDTLTGVAGLPENQRHALLQTAAGVSRAEIAAALDVSEGAVRQLVHRARTSLRAAATALTPTPLAGWAAALGADGPATQRIAEVAAGAGSAGIAGIAVKAGTVVVAAGVLAIGPGANLRHEVAKDSKASAAETHSGGDDQGGDGPGAAAGVADDDRGHEGRGRGREDGHRGRGRGGRHDETDDNGGSRRSGSSGEDRSGESSHSGSGSSGGGGSDDHSGSGSSGSSGSGESGSSGSSGSGRSGSGSSGSDSSGSGSSGSSDGGSSGSSGSGSSGSGSSGSGSSATSGTSGSSGSGSSGSGSGSDDLSRVDG
jgi:RNA polymerase sigma factor (sigma-70 family)